MDSDENEVINLDSADNVEENAQTAEEVPNDESGDEKSKKCKDNTNHGSKKVCFHFTKYNNCKHGISGRTCKFEHPKTCQKYSKYGSSQYGCSLGQKCKLFHPKICKGSLGTSKVSTNNNCHYVHLKGTKRSKVFPTQTTRKTQNNKETFLEQGQMKANQRRTHGHPPQSQSLRQNHHQHPKHSHPRPQAPQTPETTQSVHVQPEMMHLMLQMMQQMMAQQQMHQSQHLGPNHIGQMPTYASVLQRNIA